MAEWIGIERRARRCYGFDEIALVPGVITYNPPEVDTTFHLAGIKFKVPFIASAMDGVVDVPFAIEMGRLGALAVLNLDGVQTRYDRPEEVLAQLVGTEDGLANALVQKIYSAPIKEKLISKRIAEIRKAKVPVAVSTIPQHAERFGAIAKEAGADIFVVQSTVTTARHEAKSYKPVDFKSFIKRLRLPVVIGNCVTYQQAVELMEAGPAGLLVGVGPGAACTTRGVLGVGVPQGTATVDCAAARDFFYKKTGRYVPIITDGGMRTGGDICKCFACGADAIMVGSIFARAKEAPGRGYHWGMAYPHGSLPRGTRIYVGQTSSLKEIIHGPATIDDGSQNLLGAIATCMATVGARNIKEFQLTEIIIAPSIQTEGKLFQQVQRVGMARKGAEVPTHLRSNRRNGSRLRP